MARCTSRRAAELDRRARDRHVQGRCRLHDGPRSAPRSMRSSSAAAASSASTTRCAVPTPSTWRAIVGGAKKHGERNFSQGEMKYTIVDPKHPIMEGMSDFTITDEAFMRMTWAPSGDSRRWPRCRCPEARSKGEVVPQIWTYEHTAARRTTGARVRLDAGAHLHELRRPARAADDPARHRVGGQEAD